MIEGKYGRSLPPLPWLYLVTDRELARGRRISEVVEQAILGGANFIQYRDKHGGTRDMIKEAGEISQLCRGMGVPFVINDRVDVALAVNADGVHLGQSDMSLTLARDILGPHAIIGISVSNIEEAREAALAGADYLGASAVFTTSTKEDAPALGIGGTAVICRSVDIPVVGIGGIKAENIPHVLPAGVAGIAVVSAIMSSADPGSSAMQLMEIIKRHFGNEESNELL